MQISGEGKIGIGLALAFAVGSAAAVIFPEQRLIAEITMAVSLLGLVWLAYNHLSEPEHIIGRAQKRRYLKNKKKKPETPEERTERQKREFPAFTIPRMTMESVPLVKDSKQLLVLAASWHVILVHKMASVTEETASYISELVSILESEIRRKEQLADSENIPPSADLLERVRHLFVLLKGNDISIYARHHMKTLPERWEIPTQRDPIQTEFQLILAFWHAGDSDADCVQVQVDNGQPHYVRAGLGPYS